MRLVLANLAIIAAIVVLSLWGVPALIPGYRSYLPLLVGGALSWLVSSRMLSASTGIRGARLPVAGAFCAIVVMGLSIAVVISVRGA